MISNHKLEDIRKNAEEASGLPFTAWTISQAVEKDIPSLLAEVERLQKIVSTVGGIGMSGKVTVSKEVAKAIEFRRSAEGGRYTFSMFMGVATARFDFAKPVGVLNTMPIDKLASALLIGYEVEKTPEEVIKKTYEELSDYEPTDRACKDSFRFVLDTLGIKIEGVNGK